MEIPKLSARNPLGIIALFISLIYGMSALLLGTSVGSLNPHNQTILVVFIALFPFVVLWVFSWLVSKHHKKLYGPGDYRTDEGFLNASGTLPPENLGERLSADIAEEEERPEDNQCTSTPAPLADDSPTSEGSTTDQKPISTVNQGRAVEEAQLRRRSLMARAYVAEGLVFQELQNEFGGLIRREVEFPLKGLRSLRADGIIHAGTETIIVEVKMTRFAGSLVQRLREATHQMVSYRHAIQESGIGRARFLLALILDGEGISPDFANRMIQRYRDEVGEDVEIRLFSYQALLQKYGFPTDEQPSS